MFASSPLRHNPRWGRHAPSRLSYLRLNRSMSDPDLLQSIEIETLEREDLEREKKEQREELEQELKKEWGKEDQHRLHFEHTRPIHNVASVANIPSLIHQQHMEEPELTFLQEEEEEEVENEENCRENHTEAIASPSYLHKENPLVHSTPVDKSRNIRQFLASLPPPPHGSNDDGIGENIPTSNSGSGYSTPMYTPPDEEQIHLHMSAQEKASNLHNEEVRQSPQSCATTEEDVCVREPEQQSSSSGGKFVSTGIPPKPAPPPMMTKSSPSPSSVTSSVCQQHPLLSAALSVSRSQRSNSLPHTLGGCALKENKKVSNISPTSSKTSLSSLARCSPAVLEEVEVEEEGRAGGSPRAETASPLVKVGVLLEQPSEMREMDSQSESPMELTSPLEREKIMLHRRTKSDTHDISGPIKTAQISSVPERVKEIEEMNLQVASTKEQVASPDQVDTHVDSASVNDKHSSNVSHASSEESLPPLPCHASGEADKPTSPKHSSLQDSQTRHASLSPKPPSSRPLPQHMPAQTSVSLPTSVSPPEYDSGSSPHALSEEELASSLHGAVKAKIQDIEGKKSLKVGQRTQQESLQQRGEAVVRRTSASTTKRPSSEIIFHNPYIGMVAVNNPSGPSSENQISAPAPKKAETPKARRKGSICNDLFTGRGGKGGVPNEALYNAWAAILPNKHLPIDLSSVLELKQRFEVTESPRQTPSNLRRSNSLRDTRLLSPPRRLGGPGQGKQYSSNASLLLLGRNGSQQDSVNSASLSNTSPADRSMQNSSPSKSPVTS